jgi:hypothetical protein
MRQKNRQLGLDGDITTRYFLNASRVEVIGMLEGHV